MIKDGEYTTGSPEETENLGVEFAESLKPGDTVGLVGELGAGKTRFVRGVACGLGSKGHIKSPSFTIINIYGGGRLTLNHIDLYRLTAIDEFYEAGLEEYICSSGVSVIEWADKFPELMQDCTRIVRFTHKGGDARQIIFETPGEG